MTANGGRRLAISVLTLVSMVMQTTGALAVVAPPGPSSQSFAAPTVTTLVSGVNPSLSGSPVLFTVTVTSGGVAVPEGAPTIAFAATDAGVATAIQQTMTSAGPGTWTYTTSAPLLTPIGRAKLARGDDAWDADRGPQAIERYRNAWKKAQEALGR